MRVSTQSTALDNELARGASPMHSRALALRARQLVEPKRRERLASALESLCEHAQRASSTTSIVPLPRREITEPERPCWRWHNDSGIQGRSTPEVQR